MDRAPIAPNAQTSARPRVRPSVRRISMRRGVSSCSPFTNQFNFQFQRNSKLSLDSPLRQFNQRADIAGLCLAMIDEKVSMYNADLSVTDASSFQSRGFDQSSSVIVWRILEHRAHARAWRLCGLAAFAELSDFNRHFLFCRVF